MLDFFVFPVNFNDLEQEAGTFSRHRVELVDLNISQRDIIKRLKTIDTRLHTSVQFITQSEAFDFLYSLIKFFGDNIEGKSIKVLQELAETINFVTQQILRKLSSMDESADVSQMRIVFKMVMFLCLYFISSTVIKKSKPTNDLLADTLNKQKGKKKNRNQHFQPTNSLLQSQRSCVSLMKQALSVDFSRLWEKKEVDPQFFKKYIDTCVKLLQSTLGRQQVVSNNIFQILQAILGGKHCESAASSFQTVLANLVYEGQSLDNLVMFFARAQGVELQRICAQALTLVVIYLANKQNLSAQAQSIKNTRQFLTKLSQRIPKVFYTNLSCFITLFKHQSYHLRNAIAQIMCNILKLVFNQQQSEQIYKDARQKFITTLLQRIYDKSSFCRCHVLGLITQLVTERAIPKKYLLLCLKAGIDRVKDQSINTRKKALLLINAALDQLISGQLRSLTDIQHDIQLAELQLKTLAEEDARLTMELDQVQQQQRLNELVEQSRAVRKRIKATQQKQLNMMEQKEIGNLIAKVIESVKLLLGSKTDSDVLQTIRLFIKLHKVGCGAAKNALPQIRVLIFSKQKKIRDQVLTNFIYLHLNSKSQQVAKQLVGLFSRATPVDQSALEQILQTIVSQSAAKGLTILKPQVTAHLWNQFVQLQRAQSNSGQKRAIMTILRVIFSKDTQLLKQQNVLSFLNILKVYLQSNQPDFHIVKEISRIVCLPDITIARQSKHFLISFIFIIVKTQGLTNNQWFSACQSILTCVFKVCQSPQRLSQFLIQKLHQKLQKQKSVKSLCHFLFALSHTSLKCLIYLDSIEGKIKGMRNKQVASKQGEQEQLDKVMGGAQAELQRKIQQVQQLSQKMLMDPFIGKWVEITEKIVINFKQGSQLQIIAVLAYCKFLCLSASFCQQKFPHIIRLLSNPAVGSVVKNNIIIAIGDLLHRFPNIIQPYNKHLYQNLHDKDPRVRKTTLTVITHLSLNDMIKVKSDMCDLALLFQDPNPQIQSLVKQFFHQMNKKDTKLLFNLIPDALSRFSNLQTLANQSTYKVFLDNIIPLLQKDKHSQSLTIKLCQRLSNSLNLLEIGNTAYTLSQINVNQKGLRRMIQNFESYRKTLQHPDILQHFKNLILKLKKNQKTQMRPLIDQLQQKINNSSEQVFNAEEIKRRNQQKGNKRQPKKKSQSIGNTQNKTKQKRRKIDDDEDQQQQFMDIQSPAQGTQSRNRPTRNRRKMNVIEQSMQIEQDDDDRQ